MAGKLIKHLNEKAKEHPHLLLLDSQWNFDQELIPKALQNIASIFPHYSRHDASHSRQILINIERLLGDTLHKLTATDTWMLLEAAYWHDIGMLVTSEHIAADLKTDEFAQFIREIAAHDGHELQTFARSFSNQDTSSCFSAAETPQRAMELYRQLLAGWYRKKHPSRSNKIINDPWEEAGISSPRNELLPKRLFRILGQICQLHGAAFESVIAHLPFSEVGMATEDCHPRFVACLLRLGDLFDLDDNRFCPSMLRTAGQIPPSSEAHIDKHASTHHFRLDPELIELSAVCETYAGYEATDEWFRWIKDELRDQMSRWKDIVPSREFGLLPTLGKMEVNLAPPNEVIDPGERPHFGVDPEKTIELLKGAGLYETDWQCIREVMQNAVDATLVRIWLKEGEGPDAASNGIDWSDPTSEKIANLFANYPVEVVLLRDDTKVKDGKVVWKVRIRDRGIGISKQDLGFMQKVGGSSRNAEKQAIVARMPAWMRPSGAFGIGLQSVFLITDEIGFETKSILHGDGLKVRMTSPTGRERGMIYVQRLSSAPGRDWGSTLEFSLERDAIPDRITKNFTEKWLDQLLSAFDPIRMSEIPYVATKLANQIASFAQLSPLPVKLDFNGEKVAIEFVSKSSKRRYYHAATGITLIDPVFRYSGFGHLTTIAFRGQQLEKYRTSIRFCTFAADILHCVASDVLTVNRNNVKDNAWPDIEESICNALTAYIVERHAEIPDEQKPFASAFLFVYNKDTTLLRDLWQKLSPPGIVDHTIENTALKDNIEILISDNKTTDNQEGGYDLVIYSAYEMQDWLNLFINHCDSLGKHCQVDEEIIDDHRNLLSSRTKVMRFSKEKNAPFSNSALKNAFLGRIQHSLGLGGRYCYPCWEPYDRLAADIGSLPWCGSLSQYHKNIKHFVLPFFFDASKRTVTTDGLDELCHWVVQNAEKPITHEEVRDLYRKFILWIDDEVMANDPSWKTARGMDS